MHARAAAPDERERPWPKVVALWPGYGGYQRRIDREIPLAILGGSR